MSTRIWRGLPRKIRDLRAAGYTLKKKRGKGSHTVWKHPGVPGSYIVSGDDGDDAAPYQEKQVAEAVERAQGGQA